MFRYYHIGASAEVGRQVSRQYDAIFAKHAGVLPVPFIRALAKRESNMNPKQTKGSHWGLLQVGWRKGSVMDGFNRRNNTSYTKEDLLDPDINAMIALASINRIAQAYQANFPSVPNMRIDFNNPEFVKLLVAGWNSGYSTVAGVQKVVRYLVKNGIPVTHENVFRYAIPARGTRWLQSEASGPRGETARAKRDWQAGVQRLYYRMADYTPVAPTTPRPPDKVERKKLIGWGPVALILGILALILFKGD